MNNFFMFFQDFIGERGMGGLEWRYPIKPKLNNINLIQLLLFISQNLYFGFQIFY